MLYRILRGLCVLMCGSWGEENKQNNTCKMYTLKFIMYIGNGNWKIAMFAFYSNISFDSKQKRKNRFEYPPVQPEFCNDSSLTLPTIIIITTAIEHSSNKY